MLTPSPRNLELEAAAFADPDDADAWRVYADWLESVGDPRGELVSLSLHARHAYLSQRRALAEEIHARQRPFVDAWHGWAADRDLVDVSPGFDRGFVRELRGPLPQLAAHLDALFERDPIQRLILRDADGELLMEVCEQAPAWTEQLRYLKLSGELGPRGAAALAELRLPQLERLNLLHTQLDEEACGHLARLDTKILAGLTVTANEIANPGLEALLESPTRGQWRHLYLSDTGIDREGLAALARTSGLEALEGLYLQNVEASFEDFAIIFDSPNLRGIEHLELPIWGYWKAEELVERMRARLGSGLTLC